MELEPISSSCCSSSSSGEEDTAAANMTEMEAAEALADLAQLAIMRKQVFESAASWGSKGKRVRKRVKTESPPSDSLLKPPDSETLPTPDLAEVLSLRFPFFFISLSFQYLTLIGSVFRIVKL